MSHKNKNKYHGNKMNQNNGNPQEPEQPKQEVPVEEVAPEEVEPQEVEAEEVNPEENSSEKNVEEACDEAEKKINELQAQVEKEKKEYLFLMAEFDNFRKRTLREKSEIIKNAGENVLKGLLPIMDDFERGIKAAENSPEADSVKEGVKLIYNKLQKYLTQNGVKEFDSEDDTFDPDKH